MLRLEPFRFVVSSPVVFMPKQKVVTKKQWIGQVLVDQVTIINMQLTCLWAWDCEATIRTVAEKKWRHRDL